MLVPTGKTSPSKNDASWKCNPFCLSTKEILNCLACLSNLIPSSDVVELVMKILIADLPAYTIFCPCLTNSANAIINYRGR